MFVGAAMPTSSGEIGVRVVAIALGALLLIRGRRLTWLFAGTASFLAALLVTRCLEYGLLGSDAISHRVSGVDLIAVLAAVFGAIAAYQRRALAYGVIGLAAGGALSIWAAQLVVGNKSGVTFWLAVVIIAAMVLGALFTIRYGPVAVILLSVIGGVAIVAAALGFDGRSQWQAAVILSLALASVATQCHDYLVGARMAARSN